MFRFDHEVLNQEICGIKFKNPVGLSAGFDKDADLQNIIGDTGFGYAQIGSVTLKAYGGNKGRWLYRLKKTRSIIVNYGLKNIGIDKVIEKLRDFKRSSLPISISVARTNDKTTRIVDNAIEDYYGSFLKLIAVETGDFYTLNISCPNVEDADVFYKPEFLDRLLSRLGEIKIQKPVFVKMPALEWSEFRPLLDVILKRGVDGVVICNLLKNYNECDLSDKIPRGVSGGLSGKPLECISNDLIERTYKLYGDKLIIVGCGGIFSAEDAYTKIKKGASLVQLITGMIFEGPQLIGEINRGLVSFLKRDGYGNIAEAVGRDVE